MSTIKKLRPLWHTARTSVLTLAGFAGLTCAAWTTWGLGAGLAVGGASCFALEYLTGDEEARR